jgi:hypothetical protein
MFLKKNIEVYMKNNMKQMIAFTGLIMFILLFQFSCAKKSASPRSVTKTAAVDLNPAVTRASNQVASQQEQYKVNYTVSKIDYPKANTDGSYSVTSEIKTPLGQFVPITTTHSVGQLDANGVYTDTVNNMKIDIRARCEGTACQKYLMLVTVIKDNYAYYQVSVISYNQDCHFSYEERSPRIATIFQSLTEMASTFSSLQASNDCPIE